MSHFGLREGLFFVLLLETNSSLRNNVPFLCIVQLRVSKFCHSSPFPLLSFPFPFCTRRILGTTTALKYHFGCSFPLRFRIFGRTFPLLPPDQGLQVYPFFDEQSHSSQSFPSRLLIPALLVLGRARRLFKCQCDFFSEYPPLSYVRPIHPAAKPRSPPLGF